MICILHCVPTTQSQIIFHHHIFDPLYPLLLPISLHSGNHLTVCVWRGSCVAVSPSILDEIRLPRHDLLGEKKLTYLSEEKSLKHLFPWVFIWFSLHRNTGYICKAHQSLSGSNDQGENIQRTRRVYSESGSDRVMPKGHKTLGNKLILCLNFKQLT